MTDSSIEPYQRFWDLLSEAFLASHRIARELLLSPAPKDYHPDYPTMHEREGMMPLFSYGGGVLAPPQKRYYTRALAPTNLLMSMFDSQGREVPEIENLVSFARDAEIFKKWIQFGRPDFAIRGALVQGVERYFHLYGEGEPEEQKWERILGEIFRGFTLGRLPLSIVVPVLFTSFEVDRFRIAPNIVLTRMPRRLQLARSRISEMGSGVGKQVFGSATHALVFNQWHIENGGPEGVTNGLNSFTGEAEDTVERVLGCLRLSTGLNMAYSQVLYCPRHWAIEYFCDLPPVYGSAYRRYPSILDNFGWNSRDPDFVTRGQLEGARTIFRRLGRSPDPKVAMALRRLNSCFTRESDMDAVLDATIGLELLLADGHEALSYKIRMRAAGLAALGSEKHDPSRVYEEVKAIYDTRSAIVHAGKPPKKKNGNGSTSITQSTDEARDARDKAVKYLSTMLRARLELPEIKTPQDIDKRFLINFAFREMDRKENEPE